MIRSIGVCVIGPLIFGCSRQDVPNTEGNSSGVQADIDGDQTAGLEPIGNPVPENVGDGVSPSKRSDPAIGVHDTPQDARHIQPIIGDDIRNPSPNAKQPHVDDIAAVGIPKGRQAPIDGDGAVFRARGAGVAPPGSITRVPPTSAAKALGAPPTKAVQNPPTAVATADVSLPSGVRVRVSGSIFSGGGKAGDFGWMIQQEKYARTLFVYNDNEEQFDAFRRGDRPSGCSVGGGNGVIRPYQCLTPPKAIGVPTGSRGVGYTDLAGHAKTKIDQAIASIRTLAETGNYDTVLFSQAARGRTLGAGIFLSLIHI